MSDHRSRELRAYTTGFVLSVLLTVMPFMIVMNHTVSGTALMLALAAFAVLQLMVQLIFFLHMGDESKPRLRGIAFVFMLMVVLIVVVGSLWIMNHLNYHMKTPTQIEKQLESQDDL